MVQSNACPPSFAAAGLILIEGWTLPSLKAPLLRRGSSCAVGHGGWPRCAAPTADTEAVPSFVGAGHWPARGRGTPQGGFSRPLVNSSSDPLLRVSRTPSDFGWGRPLGLPPGFAPAITCSAKPGAAVELQPPQFSIWPGPSGPDVIGESHSDFARRKCCKIQQVRVPRNGGPGADSPCQGEMSRSDRGGRVGEYGHEVSILSRPPAILKVNCPEGAREGGLGHWVLSHRWESTSPRRAKPSCNRRKGSITAPSSAPFGGTFPPGGRLKKSRRRNLPHRSRPTSIPCLPTLSLPCKPTVSKTKTAGWWRAARPSARLTGRR